jgi:hypothetical protein
LRRINKREERDADEMRDETIKRARQGNERII